MGQGALTLDGGGAGEIIGIGDQELHPAIGSRRVAEDLAGKFLNGGVKLLLRHCDIGQADALGKAASSIFAVLEATHEMGERELQLVAAQDRLVSPPRRFTAERF